MREYLLVIAVTLFLAWMIPNTHVGSIDSFGTRNKDRLCWFLLFAVLSFYIGLRREYNDTYTYLAGYRNSGTLQEALTGFRFSFSDHPGFYLTVAALKTLGVSEQGFLLLFSMIFILCVMVFFRKYSTSFILSLFLLFTTNCYTFAAAAVKQNAAIALALMAILFALKGRWLIFLLLIGIASTFHTYVLLFALIPVLLFKPWTRMTYLILTAAVVIGFMLDRLLGTIIDITSMMGDTYEEENLVGEGINVFRVLVANVPTALAFIYRRTLWEKCGKAENLIINLAMLNGAIMFVGLFGKAIYFSRMASYFTVFQCVALPCVITKLPINRRKLLTWGMLAGYAGFFLYANKDFDDSFQRITLLEYITKYVLA